MGGGCRLGGALVVSWRVSRPVDVGDGAGLGGEGGSLGGAAIAEVNPFLFVGCCNGYWGSLNHYVGFYRCPVVRKLAVNLQTL